MKKRLMGTMSRIRRRSTNMWMELWRVARSTLTLSIVLEEARKSKKSVLTRRLCCLTRSKIGRGHYSGSLRSFREAVSETGIIHSEKLDFRMEFSKCTFNRGSDWSCHRSRSATPQSFFSTNLLMEAFLKPGWRPLWRMLGTCLLLFN